MSATVEVMGLLLEVFEKNGEITPEDVQRVDPRPVIVRSEQVARYAIINGGNVVQQVVLWDGGPQWSVPAGQTAVEIPDDLFVEPRGTLNPVTLAFVRAAPIVLDPNSVLAIRATLNEDLVKTLRAWSDDADGAVASWDGWTTAQRFAATKVVVQRFGAMTDKMADLLIALNGRIGV